MKRSLAVLAGAMLSVGALPFVTGSAHAACPAPLFEVTPSSPSPSQEIRITGRYFAQECNDVIGNDVTPPPAAPSSGTITFTQGGDTTTLGSFTAASDYTVDAVVTIPADASPGTATVVLTGAPEVAVTIAQTDAAPSPASAAADASTGTTTTTLPRTGSGPSAASSGTAGLLLLATGLAFVLRARRHAAAGVHE